MKLSSFNVDVDLDNLLTHVPKIPKKLLTLPGESFMDSLTSKPKKVQEKLNFLFNSGRLGKSGYLSILPLDHGIEHGAMLSFRDNLSLFDPNYVADLAIEGGCSGLVLPYGMLKSCHKYGDKIPLILKINHNDALSNVKSKQSFYSSVDEAIELGASGIAATLYFGAEDTFEQVEKVSRIFQEASRKGLFTILWAYLRNDNFKKDGVDYHAAADMTAQANYLAATIGADIIKQKFPQIPNGFSVVNKKMDLGNISDKSLTHPVDMVRLQVLSSFAGKVGVLNSGGASNKHDLQDIMYAAVINKLAGGMGMMIGRKIFSKPFKEAVKLLHLVQDLYLSKDVKVI